MGSKLVDDPGPPEQAGRADDAAGHHRLQRVEHRRAADEVEHAVDVGAGDAALVDEHVIGAAFAQEARLAGVAGRAHHVQAGGGAEPERGQAHR